ncbi:MAG TPA: histidine kinase N-terminal 7TM domain-containing protein [Methanospirillum sp.]|nr:histidine kinase N-terminal 7TM domain-containing protein [Methanospirillum sp.]
MFSFNPVAVAPLFAALLSVLLAVVTFRHRPQAGSTLAALLFSAITCYTLGNALELCSSDVETALLFVKLEYIGIALAPPIWLALVMRYTGYTHISDIRNILFLGLIPTTTLLISSSGWMLPVLYQSVTMSSTGPFPMLRIVQGPWYNVNTVYNVLMIFISIGLLILMFRRAEPFFRPQIGLLLIGSIMPFVALFLNISGITPLPDLDLTPFALVITGLTIIPAVTRFRFLDILPVAHTTVLKTISVGVIVLDEIGRVREINPAAAAIFNISLHDLGMDVTSLMPEWSVVSGNFDRTPNRCEIRLGSGTAQEAYLVDRIALEEGAGSPSGSVLMFTNITERIRAEEKERDQRFQLTTLLDALPGYAVYKDRDRRYITANQGFCAMVGLPCSEIIGRTDAEVLPPLLTEQMEPLDKAILSGEKESAEFETSVVIHDRTVVIWVRVVPFRDAEGKISGIIALGSDITARKVEEERLVEYAGIIEARNRDLSDLQERLEKVNHDLDRQVRERTHEVEMLLIQKDQFIEQLAHDLRSPLIPLVGLIPFLIEQEKDKDIIRLLTQMKTSIDAMQKMVEQLIHLANLNSMFTITDRQVYEIYALAILAVETLKPLAEEAGIEVSVEVPPHVYISLSPVHAPVILRHILSNAIRYNKPGGKVTIRAEQKPEGLLITVVDTGIGMEPEDLGRIFDEFYRSDQSRQSLEAKGLGLTIVRRIVTLNHGKIWAESEGCGKGSSFFVLLPISEIQKEP